MKPVRTNLLVFLAALGVVAGPIPPAGADTAFAVAWTDGKVTIQCPADLAGNTGLALPGLGVNKGKKCALGFSHENAHKVAAPCVGLAAADPLKKGNKKAPQAGLCTIAATSQIGPRLRSPAAVGPLPNPVCTILGKPKDAAGTCMIQKNQQVGGPWCGAVPGEDGSGSITVGTKTIAFNRLRLQWLGPLIVLTASAFKPGWNKPGQAGPILAVLAVGPDLHKILAGVPKSNCLDGLKHLKARGIAAGLVLGAK